MSDDPYHADFAAPSAGDAHADAWRAVDEPCRQSAAPPSAFDLAALAPRLPALGPVLWLTRDQRGDAPARRRGVVLIEHAALTPLAACERMLWHTRVTPQGPREWFTFVDRDDASLARMFLLPDTDYFAWDEIGSAFAITQVDTSPERWHAHAAFLRNAFARRHAAATARILTLRHRAFPWLALLDAAAPLRMSMLGLEFARAIASGEGAELLSPFESR